MHSTCIKGGVVSTWNPPTFIKALPYPNVKIESNYKYLKVFEVIKTRVQGNYPQR